MRASGYVTSDQVHAFYFGAIAVVLPSNYEGFGLPLVEALSHGTPVICTDIPPYREQVDFFFASDYVSFFPGSDSVSLTNAIAACLDKCPPSSEDRKNDGCFSIMELQ